MMMKQPKGRSINDHCYQENRITRLEEQHVNVKKKEEDLECTINNLNVALHELCEVTAGIQATFKTLQWVISITILIFGSIFVFLVTELIKMIPPL